MIKMYYYNMFHETMPYTVIINNEEMAKESDKIVAKSNYTSIALKVYII